MSDECVRRIVANLAKLHALGWAIGFCTKRGLDVADVLNTKVRTPRVVSARHDIWRLVMGSCGLSVSETGRVFDVDHTTVMSAVRKHEESR